MAVVMANCTGSHRPKGQKKRAALHQLDPGQLARSHHCGDCVAPALRQALQRPSPRPLSKLPHAHLAGVGGAPIIAPKGLAPPAAPAPGIPGPPAPPIICIAACIMAGSCIKAAMGLAPPAAPPAGPAFAATGEGVGCSTPC